jgi:hypothetical protein
MNTKEIIEMARQAGFEGCAELTWENVICTEELLAFAKLVAAKERAACAKVCDARYMGDNSREDMEAKRCAKAIRNRGEA